MPPTDSMAGASTQSTRTALEHCGWELLTDCTGTIVRTEPSLATRKPKACRAALFVAFWKMEPPGFGSAPTRAYPGSILRRKRLETTTCPTACRAMSSVPVVIKDETEKWSLAVGMGSM